jgi:hypothetical protein
VKPNLESLMLMREQMQRSLSLTEPRRVAVFDEAATLDALYSAYLAPSGGGGSPTKSVILDSVVRTLRRRGFSVRRGDYLGDFAFDVILEEQRPVVVEVLSFATTARDWLNTEHDAAHFLYALSHVDARAAAVVKSPSDTSHEQAWSSFARVSRWFTQAHIPTLPPEAVGDLPSRATASTAFGA